MPRNPDGSGSDPRLDHRTVTAISYLINGQAKTQKEAAAMAGVHEKAFSRSLHKPHVRDHVRAVIFQHTGTVAALRASRVINHLLDAESEYVQLDAAKTVLSIAGVSGALDGRPIGQGVSIRIDLGGGQAIEIGTPATQSAREGAQAVDVTALPSPNRVLGQGAGGPGGLIEAGPGAAGGLEKRAPQKPRPPSRTR